MYFPDLTPYRFIQTPYRFIQRASAPNVLNVGWLDIEHSFPREEASGELLDRLFERCLMRVKKTRGYHLCQFCTSPPFGLEVTRNGRTVCLGSAEIRVEAHGGRTYAAPDLIYHYVAAHDYRPPQEFIDALLR